jgi:hypothetical protein
MRSRKLVRAPEVICTTIWPDTTSVPAETQLRTPSRLTNHRRGFTCNGRLVYGRGALHDFTVTRDDLAGFYDYSIPGPQLPRLHLLNLVAFLQAIESPVFLLRSCSPTSQKRRKIQPGLCFFVARHRIAQERVPAYAIGVSRFVDLRWIVLWARSW